MNVLGAGKTESRKKIELCLPRDMISAIKSHFYCDEAFLLWIYLSGKLSIKWDEWPDEKKILFGWWLCQLWYYLKLVGMVEILLTAHKFKNAAKSLTHPNSH